MFDGERLAGVRTADGSERRGEAVVLAAGAWSAADWLPGAARPELRPVKGQILTLAGPPGRAVCERIVATERIYAVPRADGRLVVGATVEEQGFDTRVTAGGVHELLREAYRALPEIAELELVEAIAGLRPTTPDNLPLIGPGAIDGLVLATGHFRNGILLAPLTADRIAGLLAGRPHGGGAPMTIELNGERVDLAPAATVATAVERLGAERERRGVAVAVDGEVVPRSAWARPRSARASGSRSWGRSRVGEGSAAFELGGSEMDFATDRRHRWLSIAGADGGGAGGLGDRDRDDRAAARRAPRRRGRWSTWSSASACSCSRTPPVATRPATPSAPRSSPARRSRPTGSSSR